MHASLIYPHQLLEDHPALRLDGPIYLVEDPLFFCQYPFHKQKLVLHRASMKAFQASLEKRCKRPVHYVEAAPLGDTGAIAKRIHRDGVRTVSVVSPSDDWLQRRLSDGCAKAGVTLRWLPEPHWLTPEDAATSFLQAKEKPFFTDFYIQQRKRLKVLLDERGKPQGGKWSFDAENRKKLPKDIRVPPLPKQGVSTFVADARAYVAKAFPAALGQDDAFVYPVTHRAAKQWLDHFLEHRLHSFGDYEDAIDPHEPWLFHSVLTPMLNIGLLTPQQVLESTQAFAQEAIEDRSIAINALEGFLRQVIGWREFIRVIYLQHGRRQRVGNAWDHRREMPACFYDGTTGIEPVDQVIRRVLRYGYCHHIERLMVLGNFMLLCEIHPTAVYRWFMELFVDAYDWVMVPNVYGMSQHADGGLMTTKPYISGSSYILKMSRFQKGPWGATWDGLYWRFIDKHRDFFASNPRMSVMVKQLDRLSDRMPSHHRAAAAFLDQLQ
jgi:deoxyribodipyrimidine photolyase-related protein